MLAICVYLLLPLQMGVLLTIKRTLYLTARTIDCTSACFLMLRYCLHCVQVCCICLAKYANNDDLRELSCGHFFHMECVDKWLKINALCPLCKSEVGVGITGSEGSANVA